jgi:mitogen-activated protein kinase kinase kinase
LDHPNIVKLLDVVETNHHLNIIMEYLPGASLGASLRQQPHQKFAEATCRQIVRELAGALRYLH